jgi:pimeloyl-ACP methyl ester carboxylesterase
MTVFVLIHGAWHSAWQWRHVIPELEARGHHAVAIDLPSDDPTSTTESYVSMINSAVTEPQDVVLVAHSAAGLWAPVVAERRPVRELVLLASLMPRPGYSWIEQLADQPLQADYAAAQSRLPRSPEGGLMWSAEEATRFFHNDAQTPVAEEAVRHMVPENAFGTYREKTPLTGRPNVATRYIWCAQDRTVSRDWALRAALERFDARIEEFESSHSPFTSHPAALAALLAQGH